MTTPVVARTPQQPLKTAALTPHNCLAIALMIVLDGSIHLVYPDHADVCRDHGTGGIYYMYIQNTFLEKKWYQVKNIYFIEYIVYSFLCSVAG